MPLRDVTVTDDKCHTVSGRLGDTNGNNLLDVREVWIYTCTTTLTQTTTNTVNVTAFANGLEAVDNATITVKVDNPVASAVPHFPDAGASLDVQLDSKTTVWEILSTILAVLMILFLLSKHT